MKIYYFKTYFDTFNKNKKWRLLMNQNKLKLISPIAKESVSTLIQMNSMVGTYINNSTPNAELHGIIEKAYYFATQTKLDFENIDIKIYDALIVLLLEAKLAYEYFCEGCKDNEVTELLALANYQATEKLMMLND